MKPELKIAAIVLLLAAAAVHAGPTKGQMFTQCKLQTKAEFGEDTSVKLKRIRGNQVHLRVTAGNGEPTTIVCSHEREGVRLAYMDGRELHFMSKVD